MSDFNPETDCHDCGHRPKWRYASAFGPDIGYEHYCKRCHIKAGYHDSVTIDLDELEAIVRQQLSPMLTVHRIIRAGQPGRRM